MKELFLSLAVLAAFASCSKEEVTDVAPSQRASEISFSTLNDRITKSANDDAQSYQVYSVSTATAYTGKFYINETVSDVNVIESGEKYYWPVDGSSLSFYAYAPASVTPTTATVTSGSPTISIDYTVPTKANEDFTVAITSATANETVDLKFSHMLSKVTVKVALPQSLGLQRVSEGGTAPTVTVRVRRSYLADADDDSPNEIIYESGHVTIPAPTENESGGGDMGQHVQLSLIFNVEQLSEYDTPLTVSSEVLGWTQTTVTADVHSNLYIYASTSTIAVKTDDNVNFYGEFQICTNYEYNLRVPHHREEPMYLTICTLMIIPMDLTFRR